MGNQKKAGLAAAALLFGSMAAFGAAAKKFREPEDIDFENPYLETAKPAPDGMDYGFRKTFQIDKTVPRKVLITGSGSYIGESFQNYVRKHYPSITTETIDMIGDGWREKDFSAYDVVFHVAGIAHADVGRLSKEEKKKYYVVNTDLAIETAKKSKDAGVKQFIFMSSMSIYDNSVRNGESRMIDENTVPAPVNVYGDSKWRADRAVWGLSDDNFHVATVRPPMIYGKGSKGNYPKLAKLARITPVFPAVDNSRSMIFIDNFCEFISLLVLSGESGVYFPQNAEYSNTPELVRKIGRAAGKNVHTLRALNFSVFIGKRIPGKIGRMVDKVFGNSVYSQKISVYEGMDYQLVDLDQSIQLTEGTDDTASDSGKKKLLMLVNHDLYLYKLRKELVERFLEEGYEVHVSCPYGEHIPHFTAMGVICHDSSLNRHGVNPFAEAKLFLEFYNLIRSVRPVAVLGYTIKPNIYGAVAARLCGVPFVANITGLGTAVEEPGVKQTVLLTMYRAAFANIQCVFFQNEANRAVFRNAGIAKGKHRLLPGSGVNLTQYTVEPMPECQDGKSGEPIRFAFISRVMKEKGIDEYLAAAKSIGERYPSTEFHVCGFCEAEYTGRLQEYCDKGIVTYHGVIDDVAGFMSQMNCIVHPTCYPEGMSNILLESGASGRAVITTDRSGCREVVEDGKSGYLVAEKDAAGLIEAVEKFIGLSSEEKAAMGLAGRAYVEKRFDRQIVVEAYMEEIKKAERYA